MENLTSTEVILAVIGVVGTVSTGVISNWDKIFGKGKVVKAKYTGYRPTGNFETELRHYFEVAGLRKLSDKQAEHLILNAKNELIEKYPEDSELYIELAKRYEKERITFDDVIKRIVPIYKDHFTIEEIQGLNKFYSTQLMQNMVNKNEALAIKIAPINAAIIAEDQAIMNRLINELNEKYA